MEDVIIWNVIVDINFAGNVFKSILIVDVTHGQEIKIEEYYVE